MFDGIMGSKTSSVEAYLNCDHNSVRQGECDSSIRVLQILGFQLLIQVQAAKLNPSSTVIGAEMEVKKKPVTFVVPCLRGLLILLISCLGYGTQTDVFCLKQVKESLQYPKSSLSNWDFSNKTEGAICRFDGIECSQDDESTVLRIKLSDMGLKGHFPLGLVNCTRLIGLYLSGNSLSGSLPSNISQIIPYVTVLDLSDNDFSGPIPVLLSNITSLNDLNLAHNQFTGQIPLELGNLYRIKSFNVANNNLSGPIPHFSDNATITKDSFANNPGLCGVPLDPCAVLASKSHRGVLIKKKSHLGVIVGAIAGGVISVVFWTGVAVICISRKKVVRKKQDDLEPSTGAKSMKIDKAAKVSWFDKSVPKMTLGDLMKATNGFNCNDVIGSEITGTMYKATLRDGTFLMVKRMHNSQQTEEEFLAKMTALSNLKHPNLVPLLGFCMTKMERLLVYKYMANRNLYDQLHPSDHESTILGWPLRLKIAVGVANGLAWLERHLFHGQISSKCILLDEDFEPKLYEFSLARLNKPSDAHFSTFARGEFGYVALAAPEYSNIHSFGTVLLELITGEKPFQLANASKNFKGSLAEWVHRLSRTDSDLLHSVIDKSLIGKGVDNELFEFLSVACSCVSPVPRERPTISQVCRLLKAIGESYNLSDTGDVDFASDLVVTCA